MDLGDLEVDFEIGMGGKGCFGGIWWVGVGVGVAFGFLGFGRFEIETLEPEEEERWEK